jgi:uncharacterized protein (TIGR02597 family)
MKTSISYSLIAAAMACGFANGQTTAYTTPVGYATLNIPAGSDTTVTPAFERPTLYQGAASGIAGNVVSATGLSAGALVSGAGSYLMVTSGPLVGQRFEITANTATDITVASSPSLQSLGFVSTNTFKAVPYWTLNTMFPEGAGVGTTDDVTNATSFVFGASTGFGTNQASTQSFIYCTGDVGNDLPAGWYNNDDVFAGALTEVQTRLDLSRMYTIRTSSATNLNVVVSGQVPNSSVVIPVLVDTSINDAYLGAPYSIDISLTDSGLQSAVQPADDVTNPLELVLVYNNDASGQNKATVGAYFYCSGDVGNDLPAGWYNNDDVFAGPVPAIDKQIKAGRCIVIRKAPYSSAGSVPWTAPVPYSL